MISKSQKFPMRKEFFAWRKSAAKTSSSHFVIYRAASNSPQVAVVISKKIIKLATQRNSLKRVFIDKLASLAQSRQESMVLLLRKTTPSPNLTKLLLDKLDELVT